MSRRELPPELLQEIRDRAAGWGKIVARRAFGENGPGLDTDGEAMEQLARAAATGLAEGVLATLLEQQAQALGEQVPCPDCGTPCAVSREPRTLQLPGGTVSQQGLPITSSLAEFLVGEVHARVKSRQKYWNQPAGAEAILPLRAAVLREDGRLDRYFAKRPGSPNRRRAKKA